MTVPVPVKLPSNNMADLAYPDIQAYLKVCDMVLVPMASTEQHGPHLPLCTDTVTAIEVASRVCKINNMLHTPAIWTGYSPQHMAGPGEGRGTITIRSSTLQALMYDVARSLIHHGFNKITSRSSTRCCARSATTPARWSASASPTWSATRGSSRG
jgi:creatinine amidohydrolase